MKVINLFGGPNSGKSTLAAELFAEMKKAGLSVELVTEYAKDMVWENRPEILADQQYIFAKQSRRIKRLEGKVEWVITDSPLLLCLVYGLGEDPTFVRLVMDRWEKQNNFNFYLPRNVEFTFHQEGRIQDREGAQRVDTLIRAAMPADTITLNQRGLPCLGPDYTGQVIRLLNLPVRRDIDIYREALRRRIGQSIPGWNKKLADTSVVDVENMRQRVDFEEGEDIGRALRYRHKDDPAPPVQTIEVRPTPPSEFHTTTRFIVSDAPYDRPA